MEELQVWVLWVAWVELEDSSQEQLVHSKQELLVRSRLVEALSLAQALWVEAVASHMEWHRAQEALCLAPQQAVQELEQVLEEARASVETVLQLEAQVSARTVLQSLVELELNLEQDLELQHSSILVERLSLVVWAEVQEPFSPVHH